MQITEFIDATSDVDSSNGANGNLYFVNSFSTFVSSMAGEDFAGNADRAVSDEVDMTLTCGDGSVNAAGGIGGLTSAFDTLGAGRGLAFVILASDPDPGASPPGVPSSLDANVCEASPRVPSQQARFSIPNTFHFRVASLLSTAWRMRTCNLACIPRMHWRRVHVELWCEGSQPAALPETFSPTASYHSSIRGYKGVEGRRHTAEKRISMHPHKPHAFSQSSRILHHTTSTATNSAPYTSYHSSVRIYCTTPPQEHTVCTTTKSTGRCIRSRSPLNLMWGCGEEGIADPMCMCMWVEHLRCEGSGVHRSRAAGCALTAEETWRAGNPFIEAIAGLRARGVVVVAIAVGDGTSLPVLLDIADEDAAGADLIFTAPSFDDLSSTLVAAFTSVGMLLP